MMSFKIKVNTQSIRQLETASSNFLKQVLKDIDLNIQLGREVITDIQFQSRRGNSIPGNTKFKALSESWIKLRKRIIDTQGAPSYVQFRRSNISLSGQLLDSMIVNQRRKSSGSEISIEFEGTHQPYKVKYLTEFKRRKPGGRSKTVSVKTGKSGTYEVGERIPNSLLAKYLRLQGREFLGIRPLVERRLRNLVNAEIRRQGIKTGRIIK